MGARVDLYKADLSVSPLGLELLDIQITNPDEPMSNIVQIERIAFLISSTNLLRKKLFVEEMVVESVRFNTPRKRSGAISSKLVSKKVKKSKVTRKIELPSFTPPLMLRTYSKMKNWSR